MVIKVNSPEIPQANRLLAKGITGYAAALVHVEDKSKRTKRVN